MKATETVYRCDAPDCDVARPAGPDGKPTVGIELGSVEYDGTNDAPRTADVFACRRTHIGPAVRAALAAQES